MFDFLLFESRRVVKYAEQNQINNLKANHHIVAVPPIASFLDDDPGDERHDLSNDRGGIEETDGYVAVFARHNFLGIVRSKRQCRELLGAYLNSSKGHFKES